MKRKGLLPLSELIVLILVLLLIGTGALMASNAWNIFSGDQGAPWDVGTYDSFDRLLDEIVELLDEPGAYKYHEHLPFTLGPRFAVAGFNKNENSIPIYYGDKLIQVGIDVHKNHADVIEYMRPPRLLGRHDIPSTGILRYSEQDFPRPPVCPQNVACICLITIKGDIWDTLSERASNLEQLFRSIGNDLGTRGYPVDRYDLNGARCHFFEEDIIFYSVAEDVTPSFPGGFSDSAKGFNPRLLSYGLPQPAVYLVDFYDSETAQSSEVHIQPTFLFFGGIRPYAIDDGLGFRHVLPTPFLRFFGSRNLFIDILDLTHTTGGDEKKYVLITPHRGYNYTASVHADTTLDELFSDSFYNPVPNAHKKKLSHLSYRDAGEIRNKLISPIYSDIEKLAIFVDYLEWAAHPLLHTAEQFNSTMRALQPDALQRIADIVQRGENACDNPTSCDTFFIACDDNDPFCSDVNERLGLFFTLGVHETCLVKFRLAGTEPMSYRNFCPPVKELLARLAVWRAPEARSEIVLDTFMISRMEQRREYDRAFLYFKDRYIDQTAYTLAGIREHFPQFVPAFSIMRESLRDSFSLPDAQLYFALFDDVSYVFGKQDPNRFDSDDDPLTDLYGKSGLVMNASYDSSGRLTKISDEDVRVYPYELDQRALEHENNRSIIGLSLGLRDSELFARHTLAFHTDRANRAHIYTYLALHEILLTDSDTYFSPFDDFTYTTQLLDMARTYNVSIDDGYYEAAFDILLDVLDMGLNHRYPQYLQELEAYIAFLERYFPYSTRALELYISFLDGERTSISDVSDAKAFCYINHGGNSYLAAVQHSFVPNKIFGEVPQLSLTYVQHRDSEENSFYQSLDQLFSSQTYRITTPSQQLAYFVLWQFCTEGAS